MDSDRRLYTVIGNDWGGDGGRTFALPRVPAPDGTRYRVCAGGPYAVFDNWSGREVDCGVGQLALRPATAAPGRPRAAEVVLAVAVLGVTAALVSYAPASANDAVLSESAPLGPVPMELTVAPLQTGPQELHLYLLDGRTGAPWRRIEEVEVTLEQRDKGVGPLDAVQLERAGPGYVAEDTTLAIAGDWNLRTDLRVSEFDAYGAEVEVPIR